MKFAFEDDLDYQRAAIDAVVDLFHGQEALTGQFTVLARKAPVQSQLDLDGSSSVSEAVGTGNRLELHHDALLANLHAVQDRTGLPRAEQLDSTNFTVEMETGTGKTYVYLRTVHELHERYGFTKFVVVVPSVAISEGVTSALTLMREHFAALYPGRHLSSFTLDGGTLSRIRSFATSSGLELMITTAAAINKATNRIHQPVEDLGDEIPMDLVRATRPIVIVDEPQSVYGDDGNPRKAKGAGRTAIEGRSPTKDDSTVGRRSLARGMTPTAVLRYSATHPKFDRANLVYRLDAIAAYEQGLVKQIEVDSLVTEASGSEPYVKLLATKRTGSTFSARLELDVEQGNRTQRKAVQVRSGANLEDVTGRARYRDLTLDAVSVNQGSEYVRFGDLHTLRIGDAIGSEVSVDERARQMIAQTVRQHLRKEQEFAVAGRAIKVLSLFFVDSVAKYRVYDENGDAQLGEYARLFEEEYTRVAAAPEFAILLGSDPAEALATRAHQGYFSIDRRKGGGERLVDTAETNDRGRQQAGLAYEQIMRDKVALTTPGGSAIRFIFSHSALQEGWDNPNVFQICVLRTIGTERWRRQSIGRGLRICVDGDGRRVHAVGVNRLTVLANESYEEFAEQLQRELADDLGVEFGLVTVDGFARLTYAPSPGASPVPVGDGDARAVFAALVDAGFVTVTKQGVARIEDTLRQAVAQRSEGLRALVETTVTTEPAQDAVQALIRRLARPIDVKKAGRHRTVPIVDEQLDSPEFRELWKRIRHRTQFRVRVDEKTLRDAVVEAIRGLPSVPERKGVWQTRVIEDIDQSGLRSAATYSERVDVTFADSEDLPDILSILADRTQLTRRTLAEALTASNTLPQFRKNPQVYVDQVTRAIVLAKERLMVEGLRYELVPESRPDVARRYDIDIFQKANLGGYVGPGGNIVADGDEPLSFAAKSPYRYLVVDSQVEAAFARGLIARTEVKSFVKLPSAFTIPTPLGDYNPDWAVVVERADGSRYLVFETKGTVHREQLRPEERGKIEAAERHFAATHQALGFDDLTYGLADGMATADALIDAAFSSPSG